MAAPALLRAQAAWKPAKPITIYNPLAAGGVCDVHLRFLGERVGRQFGQQVIVDIKAGAGATLAAAQMVNTRPDGYTIACMTINSLRYPHYQTANWHPLRDFSYIIGLSEFTFGVVVRADSPYQTIGDLIEAGRREPEKLNYGTSGIGGTGHLLMLETEQATGARFTHIPYKGGAEFMPALLGGHIQFVPDGAQWAPFVENGQVRVLAMATPQRLGKYPDKPTLVESGINAVAVSPYGLVGPEGPAAARGPGAPRCLQGGDGRSRSPAAARQVHPGAVVSRSRGLSRFRREVLRRGETDAGQGGARQGVDPGYPSLRPSRNQVEITPFPFTSPSPRGSRTKSSFRSSKVSWDT